MSAEVSDGFVHQGLQRCDTASRIVVYDWPLHPGMICLAGLTEQVVRDFAVDDGAVVVVEFGLYVFSLNIATSDTTLGRFLTYLPPFSISAVKGLAQLGIVNVQSIGAYSHDRTILVMKLLDADVVGTRTNEEESPPVRPTY